MDHDHGSKILFCFRDIEKINENISLTYDYKNHVYSKSKPIYLYTDNRYEIIDWF